MDATASAQGPVFSSIAARNIAVACAMAAMFMQTLDQTIANVALPHMQGSLAASRDQITWVLTSYIIATAIMTAPVGWIASRFGKRRFIMVAVGGFTITSALCGMAQNLDQIILFRLLQGAFGAALGPLSQTIMMDMFPPQSRGSVMGIWGMGVMLGPILGPTLGGYLTDSFSWRAVFYINVPVGIASVIGLVLFYKDPRRDKSLVFDWFGFSLLMMG
ncbi:MAG TPA: DHA2 family efflux MFS transporter permease subunit, partial [Pseudomonadales bacterium]|nr:DHA2 family efflux MFS transporter permease subunit [Pseudomonadales bacterium]